MMFASDKCMKCISSFGSTAPRIHRLLVALCGAFCLGFLPLPVSAALWTSTNLVSWVPGVTVGVQGGIDQYYPGGSKQRTNLIDVTKAPYNADPTGKTDDTAALQSAMNAATNNQVVYLPPGTYLLNQTLNIALNQSISSPRPITVRGAGTNTIIKCGFTGGYQIFVGSASDYNWTYPASGNTIAPGGFVKGSTNLAISDTSAFVVGGLARIEVNNDTNQFDDPVTVHVSSYQHVRGQTVMITAKTATTLTFWPPLYSNYGGLGGSIYCVQYQANQVGLEDFELEMTNCGIDTIGITFEQCVNCWLRNITIRHCHSYCTLIQDTDFQTIVHCDIEQTIHSGMNGAGIEPIDSCAGLIENNIIAQNFPGIEVDFASCGNVFGYNFIWDTYQTQSGNGIDSNHGPHNSFNLYEGNEAPYFQADGWFGSVSDDTLFRNWFHGVQPETPGSFYEVLSLNRFTRNYNLIGNLFGTNGCLPGNLRFGDPYIGSWGNDGTNAPAWPDWNKMLTSAPGSGPGQDAFYEFDTNVLRTTTFIGNYYFSSNHLESMSGFTLGNSLYQTSKPAWFGNLTWPPFDPASPSTATFTGIPAGYRYFFGSEPPGVGSGSTNNPPVVAPPTGLQVMAAANSGNSASNSVPAPNVAWWKMIETAGSTLTDYTGNGNSGTTVASPAWESPGLLLNGASQYVAVARNKGLPLYGTAASNDVTVSMWVYIEGSSSEEVLYSEGTNGGGGRFFIDYNNSANPGKISIYLPTVDSPAVLAGNTTLSLNTWYNIVWTDNAGTAQLYINGVADGANFSYTPAVSGGTSGIGIGAVYDGQQGDTFAFTDGIIADMRLWNNALSSAQVSAIYSAGKVSQ